MLRLLLPEEREVARAARAAARASGPRGVARSTPRATRALEDQDRSLWDAALIAEADALDRRRAAGRPAGRFTLQAAIAAPARRGAELRRRRTGRSSSCSTTPCCGVWPSPVVALNRAVVVADGAPGPRWRWTAVEALESTAPRRLPLPAGRPRPISCAGSAATRRRAEAYREALRLTDERAPERAFLFGRLERAGSTVIRPSLHRTGDRARSQPAAVRASGGVEAPRGRVLDRRRGGRDALARRRRPATRRAPARRPGPRSSTSPAPIGLTTWTRGASIQTGSSPHATAARRRPRSRRRPRRRGARARRAARRARGGRPARRRPPRRCGRAGRPRPLRGSARRRRARALSAAASAAPAASTTHGGPRRAPARPAARSRPPAPRAAASPSTRARAWSASASSITASSAAQPSPASSGPGLVQHRRPPARLEHDRRRADLARHRDALQRDALLGDQRRRRAARVAGDEADERGGRAEQSAARATLRPLPPGVTATSASRRTSPGPQLGEPRGAVDRQVRAGDEQRRPTPSGGEIAAEDDLARVPSRSCRRASRAIVS